jgi:phosphoribosylglycinamide formyltransferase-1
VNLLVDLDERFEPAIARAREERLRNAGFALLDLQRPEERYLSWIDLAFGGTWSGESANASLVVLTRAGDAAPVGFAAHGANGLRFYWLRAWANRRDVGIFGPSGVQLQANRDELHRDLVFVALARMRARGSRYALIPAVTESIVEFFVSATGGKVVETFSMDRIAPDIRTTVLASGGGTNFQAVIDNATNGLGLDLRALVVNRRDAFAIQRAKRAGIPVTAHLWNRATTSRERYDEELLALVERTEPQLILMLGWMHLVSANFIERFVDIINIHPAFLPHDDRTETVTMPDGTTIRAFRGAHAIRDALAAGSPWYGATAHRVVVETDRGQILQRFPQPLTEKDEESALAALRSTEHHVLLGAIRRYVAER